MARTIDQVLAEVSAKSDPQRTTVLNQIADLPNQQIAAETGLAAKKDQAYTDILDGARRRGLGFAGIPLGEQAKYNATDYAPAVANLKSTFNTRKGTLESALADIGRNDYLTANDIYNQERAFEEQQRQFNENMAYQREQARASAASSNALGSFLGGGYNQPSVPQPAAKNPTSQAQKPDKLTQTAYNEIKNLISIGQKDPARLQREYNAILKSAGYGNAKDKIKLQLLQQGAPNFFKGAVSANALGNGGSLRF